MAMLGNGSRNNLGAGYQIASVFALSAVANRNTGEWVRWVSQDMAQTTIAGAARPTGYYAPATYYMPQKAGEISMQLAGSGSAVTNLYPSKNMEAAFSGSGSISLLIQGRSNIGVSLSGYGDLAATISAFGELLITLAGTGDLEASISGGVDMSAALSGAGDLSAVADLIIAMGINLSGSGDLDATAVGGITMSVDFDGAGDLSADINGRRNIAVSLSGSGDLEADMSALGNMLVALSGSGDLESFMAAYGDMSIDIATSGSGLSVGAIVDGIWNAVAANYDTSGTMGELLNLAASGGLSPEQIAMLTELWKLAGLDASNPMTVTTTSRTAGDIDLEITGDGVTTTTVTRL